MPPIDMIYRQWMEEKATATVRVIADYRDDGHYHLEM